jgi:hypothetical protein
VDSKGLQKVDRHRSRPGPGRRPTATPKSR